DDFPRGARRLHADIPVRARADEQAHLDAVLTAERQHPPDFVVGLQHDAASLADAIDRDAVFARRRHDGLHRLRPLARRNFDSIRRATGEALRRCRQVVGVARRELQAAQRVGRGLHAVYITLSPPSTAIDAPVMADASSDATQATTLAISIGVAMR